ncbi:putative cytidylate kinase [uncultured Desulfobacterium sp.]|uniref:Putative cytidylate kinase n=1 Tax=uncultured Desulfobacterium sp. TaxID=201089 RepID=A0A445MWR4_9BACT|nr:putative cytidylate kinase [uncultured Desulfobacterium sp.]
MKAQDEGLKYVPGFYAKKRPGAEEIADKCIREWEGKKIEDKKKKAKEVIYPTICFSREIGVGALEVADILGEMLGYRVVDRQLIEHISKEARLSEKTVNIFDERYPGKLNECLTYLFGEKAFIKSDYSRHLFSGIFAIAGLGPTIFVGRGAHLVLPREDVFAVRLICSRQYRVKRLAKILKAKEKEIEAKLDQLDKEQKNFFKRVFGKKDAFSPYEFDMVINCDYIKEPKMVAEIVAAAFQQKHGAAAKKK